jgi:hypothetical protein
MKIENVAPMIPKVAGCSSLYLNPDFAYLLWQREGSCREAAEYLASAGITSYQGKKYTRAAVHLAAQHSSLYAEGQKKLAEQRKIATRKMQRDFAKD